MAVQTKTTDAAIQNLSRRSNEDRVRLRKLKVEKAMKVCDGLVDSLYDYMINLGYDDVKVEDCMKAKEANQGAGGSKQAQAVFARKQARKDEVMKKAAESIKLEAAEDHPEFADLPWDSVPDSVHALCDFTVPQLRDRILPSIESSHASAANLRATKDKELNSKSGLLKLVDMGTGCAADYPISGKLRCYNRLAVMLQKRSQDRGRRILHTVLPPQWVSRDGICRLDGDLDPEAGKVGVVHKFTKESVELQREQLPPHDNVSELYLESSWSEAHICVGSTNKAAVGKYFYVANLFTNHSVSGIAAAAAQVSPTKKRPPTDTDTTEEVGAASKKTKADMAKAAMAMGEHGQKGLAVLLEKLNVSIGDLETMGVKDESKIPPPAKAHK